MELNHWMVTTCGPQSGRGLDLISRLYEIARTFHLPVIGFLYVASGPSWWTQSGIGLDLISSLRSRLFVI